jgi:hypothetical protein
MVFDQRWPYAVNGENTVEVAQNNGQHLTPDEVVAKRMTAWLRACNPSTDRLLAPNDVKSVGELRPLRQKT